MPPLLNSLRNTGKKMATKEPLYTRATVLADRGGKRRCVHVLCASAREKEMQERDLSITLLQRKEDMQE
jgi:hypothetical protein